jgi:hypothetical protein
VAKSLAKLFDGGDDFALCDRLFVRLCEVYGNGADVAALTDEERTAYLVWAAVGVIGNGGFRYLFEHELPGDPHFALTRHAFEAIGCEEAVQAFDRTLALFPGGRPPTAITKRLRAYSAKIAEWPTPEDRLFFQAKPDIVRGLGRWVRSRQRAFAHLG